MLHDLFDPPFHLVAIAASHGGVQALSAVLEALPPSFPAPVVVAQHLPPTSSALVPILRRRTRLAVRWAEHGARLRPETVFVGPPGFDVRAARGGTLALVAGPKVNHVRPAADVLFRSAALAFGGRALAVVLTGNGRDGAAGARLVRSRGGAVIAQEPATCMAPGMPQAVVADGSADFVLPLDRMGPALVSLVAVPGGAALFGVGSALAAVR